MILSKLFVKPYVAAVNTVLHSPLLFIDLPLEVVLGVLKALNETFYIR